MQHSPLESALYRATHEEPDWSLQEHLLAGIFDVLTVLAWQNTEDGTYGRNPPMPLPRPGVVPDGTRIGGRGAMTTEEADAWLAARNPLQHMG